LKARILIGWGWGVLMLSLGHPTAADSARRHFRIVLIKPSHYDDGGYVIRWYRSPMPANSLASVYGLIDDCAQRHILGSDTDIDPAAVWRQAVSYEGDRRRSRATNAMIQKGFDGLRPWRGAVTDPERP
jgi:hypothetical protein